MAVAKSDPAAEMIQSLAQYSRVRKSLQLIYYSIATLAGMLVLLLLVVFVLIAIGEPEGPSDSVAASAFRGFSGKRKGTQLIDLELSPVPIVFGTPLAG